MSNGIMTCNCRVNRADNTHLSRELDAIQVETEVKRFLFLDILTTEVSLVFLESSSFPGTQGREAALGNLYEKAEELMSISRGREGGREGGRSLFWALLLTFTVGACVFESAGTFSWRRRHFWNNESPMVPAVLTVTPYKAAPRQVVTVTKKCIRKGLTRYE